MAPSLVIVISPSGDYNILSIPFGPIELLNAFDMHLAALILTLKASTPLTRDFAAYSLISKKTIEGKIEFKDLMGGMMDLSNLKMDDEEDYN